jgi:hypothetical protein
MRRVARCQGYHEEGRQLSDGKGPVPAAAGLNYGDAIAFDYRSAGAIPEILDFPN